MGPRVVAVAPRPAPDTSSPSAPRIAPLLYEIVPCSPLPSFDATKTMKQVLLTSGQIKVYNRIFRVLRHFLLPLYAIGFALRTTSFFASASTGRWAAPVSFVLQLPLTINTFLFFRYDYLKLLASTFDLWFLIVVTVLWALSFVIAFQDARIWALPSCCFDFINAFLMEAFFSVPQLVFGIAVVTMGYLTALSYAVTLGQINELHLVHFVQVQGHEVSTRDVLVNCMATVFMLFARLAYSMFRTVRKHKKGFIRTESNEYHCRIKLRGCQLVGTHIIGGVDINNGGSGISHFVAPISSTAPHLSAAAAASPAVVVSMRLSRKKSPMIDPAKTLMPQITKLQLQFYHTQLLHGVGVIGLLCTLLVSISSVAPRFIDFRVPIAVVGLLCTLSCCIVSACYAQRTLLLQLVKSFHFLFLSLQITLAHACAADLLYWNEADCCACVASWTWMHWILLLDTLCPVSKRRLRLRRADLSVVMMWCYVIMQTCATVEVMVWNHWDRQDRVLWSEKVSGHVVTLNLVPFLLNRQLTVLAWTTRLVWRRATRRDNDELILLQGTVVYDAPVGRQLRRQRAFLDRSSRSRARERASNSRSRKLSAMPFIPRTWPHVPHQHSDTATSGSAPVIT